MTDEEFLSLFAETVGAEPKSLTLDTELSSLEAWDSVAYLSTMTLIDEKMGVAIDPELLVESRTVGDILSAARTQIS
jgi:acyl carrier protein